MKIDEILKRRTELVRGPLYNIPQDRIDEFRKVLADRCPKSKQLYDKAVTHIPGGAQHMLVIKDPFPIAIKRAQGSRAWDSDDNEYIDYLMMAGPIILGHNYAPLIEKVIDTMKTEGIGTGWTSEWEIKAAALIKKHMPSVELFRYFQSGTEADMAAVRLARVYTDKQFIIKIGGAYHGWSDQFTYDMHIPHSGTFESHGIPEECFSKIISITPNDIGELERAFERGHKEGGVAGLIIEPLGPESGAIPMLPEYPKVARELCDKYDSLLIFDEVVTAFRIGMGGAQEYYDVKADLTVFGKILTHGFPSSGGLGGRKDVMECLVAGLQPGKARAFVGGTMCANPLSSSATYWSLKFIEEEDAIEKSARAADMMVAGLNELFERMGFPFFAYNFKSIVHFETAAPLAVDIREPEGIPNALNRKQAVDDLATALLAEGVITKYGNRAFTCIMHTEKEIDSTLEAFEKVLKVMSA
jgi:glutamate-1-semialdehyde 2,1-aminomutase